MFQLFLSILATTECINDVLNSRLCGCKTKGAELTSLKWCHGLMSLGLALSGFGENQPEQNKKLDLHPQVRKRAAERDVCSDKP